MNETSTGGENVERGERRFFVATQNQPDDAREVKDDQGEPDGDHVVETEQAADRKGEADGKERRARRGPADGSSHAGDFNGT